MKKESKLIVVVEVKITGITIEKNGIPVYMKTIESVFNELKKAGLNPVVKRKMAETTRFEKIYVTKEAPYDDPEIHPGIFLYKFIGEIGDALKKWGEKEGFQITNWIPESSKVYLRLSS